MGQRQRVKEWALDGGLYANWNTTTEKEQKENN
jgi:hypothetical protein